MTPALTPEELVEYLLDIGGALLSYGCPTYRLEAVIRDIAELEGLRAEAFAVPTGLFIQISGDGAPTVMRMVRVKDWGVDLERLALIDRIFNDVLDRKCSLADARRLLDEVERRPRPYPTALRWASSAVAAAAAAIFFRGRPVEAAIALGGGLIVGVLATLLDTSSRTRLLMDFLGGLIAAGLALGATAFRPDLSREVVVLSIIILLVPGMAMTTGLAELAHKNLVSGASKLMEAMMTFISILFGIAALVGIERFLHINPGEVAAHGSNPIWLQWIALVAAAFAFAVIYSVPRALLPHAMVSGGVGWIVATVCQRALPGYLAAFCASLAVALFANGFARALKRPAQIFLLPGLILLVPGSVGFLSLEAFLRGELLGGAAHAFEMFLVAGAIVTGLLVANVVLPARKLL